MTPLELLHPRGLARSVLVLGCCPERLRPAAARDHNGGAVDLVVVGPGASPVGLKLADDAIVCMLGGGPASDLRQLGLRATAQLLHVPSLDASACIVELRGSALTYAFADRRSPRARAAALVARLPFGRHAIGFVGDTSMLFARPGATPLAWFPSASLGEVVIDTSWHGSTSTSVVRAVRRGEPTVVAKVGAGPSVVPAGLGEATALKTLGPGAAAAGVAVPTVLDELSLAGTPVTIESALRGVRASSVARGDAASAAKILDRLTTWLGDWNEATAAPVRGQALPSVAVHQDLTLANVLVEGSRLGIVDWASARPDGLPLTDFFYAAVDARAAVDGYRDRPAAFDACFTPAGDWFSKVQRLEARLRDRLGVAPDQADLAFRETWRRHADNETRRAEEGRDFRQIALRAREVR